MIMIMIMIIIIIMVIMMMMMMMMMIMMMMMMMIIIIIIMIMMMMILKTSGGALDRQGYPDPTVQLRKNQDTAPYFAPGIQTHKILEISI